MYESNKENGENKNFFTFSNKKGKYSFTIENTVFAPKLAIFLSPKTFEEKYLEQLEEYVYTSKETIDIEKIYSIMYLFSLINRGHYPIYVNTNKYRSLLNKIVRTMNIFFNQNYSVIRSIYIMFNGLSDTLDEEKRAEFFLKK